MSQLLENALALATDVARFSAVAFLMIMAHGYAAQASNERNDKQLRVVLLAMFFALVGLVYFIARHS